MERLRQVVYLLALASYCTLAAPTASAQDGCSLVVRVLATDGRRPGVPVSVREQSGRVEEKEQGDSDVRFCDLGILRVTFAVGSDSMCDQVTVHEVPVSLDDTYLLTVTYNPLACPETIPPPEPACKILFRIADAGGKWISGASVRLAGPTTTTPATDQFGRALFEARMG